MQGLHVLSGGGGDLAEHHGGGGVIARRDGDECTRRSGPRWQATAIRGGSRDGAPWWTEGRLERELDELVAESPRRAAPEWAERALADELVAQLDQRRYRAREDARAEWREVRGSPPCCAARPTSERAPTGHRCWPRCRIPLARDAASPLRDARLARLTSA